MKTRTRQEPQFALDDVDWDLVAIRADHDEGFTPEALEGIVRDAHRTFRDSRDVQRILPAARGVLALLRWQLRKQKCRCKQDDALAPRMGEPDC